MLLTAISPSAVALIGLFAVFAIFMVLALAVAYAKRDVNISVTLFEFH